MSAGQAPLMKYLYWWVPSASTTDTRQVPSCPRIMGVSAHPLKPPRTLMDVT
jgi:hypothetical protein